MGSSAQWLAMFFFRGLATSRAILFSLILATTYASLAVADVETPTSTPSLTQTPTPSATPSLTPKLEIGRNVQQKIAVQTQEADFHYPLLIEALNTTGTVAEVILGQLTSSGGTWQATPSVTTEGRPVEYVEIPGLGSAQLDITGRLPAPGTYIGVLSLVYDGRRESAELTVTWTLASLPIEILGVPRHRSSSAPGSAVEVRFTLRETASSGAVVDSYALVELGRIEDTDIAVQPRGDVSFLFSKDDGTPLPTPLTLQPNAFLPIKVRIAGLSEPGKYSAKLRLSGAASKTVDKDFTFQVKRPWWCAAIVIFAGVLVSFLIRRFQSELRPRLLRTRRVEMLDQELAQIRFNLGQPTPRDEQLFSELARQIAEAAIAVDQGADNASVLDHLDRRLSLTPLFLVVRRRAAALPPGIQINSQTLVAADLFLRSSSGTATDLEGQQKALLDLDAEISEETLKHLRENYVDLKRDLEEQLLVPGRPPEFLTRIEKILDLAREGVNALGREGGEVEATRVLMEARGSYARLLAQLLLNELGEPKAPVGISPAAWTELRERVTRDFQLALEAKSDEAAVERYERGYVPYLRGLIGGLTMHVDALIATPAQADPDALATAKGLLEQARSALRASKLAEAHRLFTEAQAKTPPPKGQMGTSARAADAAAAITAAGETAFIEAVETAGGPQKTTRAPRQSIALITRRIAYLDTIVSVVVLVVAVVLGLRLLWIPSPAWGSLDDILVAALWGLGLHEVSKSSFKGIRDLATEIKK